jgi:UbiD family decarboxylase
MWREHGKDCPWAMSFGAPPLVDMIGGAPLPDFANECDYIGALAGTPVEVVKCKTNDCYVPANSEIVFEGRISINEMVDEGPYGEMHGYLWKGQTKSFPVFTVEAITYRNNPIMPVSPTGRATDETHTIMGITTAAAILFMLKESGIPVINVWRPTFFFLRVFLLIYVRSIYHLRPTPYGQSFRSTPNY